MQQERRVRPEQQQQQQQPQPQPQQQPQRCPRCESLNTKFCYFNNYSLSQPRYFCKTCRRYWTQGGTLRNVPVGGGCRKGKRSKRPSSSSTSNSSYSSLAPTTSSDSGYQHNLLLPQQHQPQQDSIVVATTSNSPLRNGPDATAGTGSSCSSSSSSSSPSSFPYYSGGGGGFFSSLIALQSFNHAMNVADFSGLPSSPATSPFNLPMLPGFGLPLHQQQQQQQRIQHQQQQQSQGFQMGGGVIDRPLQQLLLPMQPSRPAAATATTHHQEWPPHTIAPDGDYWNSSSIGGAPTNTSHWPDLPGYGPSSSSPSFL